MSKSISNKSRISKCGTLTVLIAVLAAPEMEAQSYPLSENTWDNPEFVERFMGTYGFDTSVTPSITAEEKTLFETIAPLISSDPPAAIAQLQASITPESSGALIYTLGNLHFQQGNLDEAEGFYREALKRFPNFLRAYRNVGIVLVQEGKFSEARDFLLKALQLGAEDENVYGLLGYCYLNEGKASSALRAYENALFFNPDSRDWRMGKIQCLSNIGAHREVIGMIDEFLNEFPDESALIMMQANAFIAEDQPEEAAAALEILRLKGDIATSALVLLGDIYINFQQPDLALGVYREAAERTDLSFDRKLTMARRLSMSNAWDKVDALIAAIETSASGLNDDEELEFLNLKAQSDLAQERRDAAAEKLAEVVQKDPLNGQALLLLGEYEWKNGNRAKATIYYERAAKVDETAADALVQHARMLVANHSYGDAVPLLERAQRLEPRPYVGNYLEKVESAARASR